MLRPFGLREFARVAWQGEGFGEDYFLLHGEKSVDSPGKVY